MSSSNLKSRIDIVSIDDLLSLDDELSVIGATEEELEARKEHPFFSDIAPKLEVGIDLSRIIRDEVHTRVKSTIAETQAEIDDKELHKQKKAELYEILEHIDEYIAGRSVEEVVAFFTSLHDIVSQICLQQTEGVVVAKVKLNNFFDPATITKTIPREFMQEVSLIFSKDEINALHAKMPEIPDKDPYKALFSTILDQSYDMVLFNELSGYLLIYMTKYFILKLREKGYGRDPKVLEFIERHTRTKHAFFKALGELKSLEEVLNQHLEDYPILNDFPKYLRMILQIKAGLISSTYLAKMLMLVKEKSKDYAKASKTTAFDFHKLPQYQHEIQIKQAVMISLQKDTLKFTIVHLEEEFENAKTELDRLVGEIEVFSEAMDSNSPEFRDLVQKKSKVQMRVEQTRRNLDVVRNQLKLVDIQHNMIKEAIQRYREREKSMAKPSEIKPVKKIKIGSPTPAAKRRVPQRMVMARKLRG